MKSGGKQKIAKKQEKKNRKNETKKLKISGKCRKIVKTTPTKISKIKQKQTNKFWNIERKKQKSWKIEKKCSEYEIFSVMQKKKSSPSAEFPTDSNKSNFFWSFLLSKLNRAIHYGQLTVVDTDKPVFYQIKTTASHLTGDITNKPLV